MHIEYWPPDKLQEYARNPRKNAAHVEKMAASIQEFGFTLPILARSDGEVVDGHLRLKAARHLGLEQVPVALADHLTPAQVKAFRLMIRNSATWADWDDELLQLEIEELQAMDYDLALTGFAQSELDSWLADDITVLDSEGDLDSGNYADNASKTTVPVNILGIGGMVERRTMEMVKSRLIEQGATVGGDNGECLTAMFTGWLS